MRWWFHIIAALFGLSAAALIVFLVFGSASSQSTTEGPAPTQAAAGTGTGASGAACGSINPASVFDTDVVAAAATELPTIMQDGTQVKPARADQTQWFARLQAASGRCIERVVVTPKTLSVTATYPAGTSQAALDAYAYAMLTRAFDKPLARSVVSLDLVSGGTHHRVTMSAAAWSSFQKSRASLGLPPSMRGIAQSRSKIAYPKGSVSISGF